MIFRIFVSVWTVLSLGFTATAFGQFQDNRGGYPSRAISLVLPFPPGAATDAVARIMSKQLSESMGQPWIVDNRGGAAGNIAAVHVARAAPDGYTIFLGFSTVLTVNPSLYATNTFDPIKDFSPISQTATSMYKLVTHSSLTVNSVKDLVALAKARPGQLNYASAGVASPLHLAAELFKSRTGADIVHVAYKGGGPAAAAVLSGEVQLIFTGIANSSDLIKAGKLRALAVTGLKRSVLEPNLPTLDELGFPGFEVTTWHSFLAPAGTPLPIIKRLNAETLKMLKAPEVETLVTRSGYETTGTTPEALSDIIRNELRVWAKITKDANIRPD